MANKDKVVVNLDAPRYDQSTFFGRLRHFMDVTDMRLALTTEKQLDDARRILKEYQDKGRPPVSQDEAENIWKAKKIKDAMVHPDTNQTIPWALRFSSFVPLNIGICAGMLTPNPTIASTLFWQWTNQSYNIALNYANRNASSELPMEKIATSYVTAVAVSCGVAVGLGQFVKRSAGFSPAVRNTIKIFVPYTAVAIAGIANVFLMRGNEIKEGIYVKDSKGKDLGKSQKAGIIALSQVAVSRCVIPLPALLFPPAVMAWLDQTNLIKNNPRLRTPVNLGVIGFMLWSALPVAIAIFPQIVEISPDKLEPQFHGLKDDKGKPITKVYFNRGL